MKITKLLSAVVLATLLFSSCKNPKDKDETPSADIAQKVYVLNEGAFGSGNASVSIYDNINNKMYNDLFEEANSRPIGDVLQSMALINDKAYFVVNNSNKIEVTGTYPLTSTAVIKDLEAPRYMVAVNSNKAYVSEHVSFFNATGKIAIINLSNNSVKSTIDVGARPEGMILHNGKMYVCISGEDEVTVINTSTNTIEDHITVADGPAGIVKDANGKLWVVCGGKVVYDSNPPYDIDEASSTKGALVRIDPSTNTVEQTFTFSDIDRSYVPAKITINGSKNKIYFGYAGKLYAQTISASSLSTTSIINRDFYSFGVDPLSGIVYIGTYGFSSNQKMIRYKANGEAIDSVKVGVGPNSFYFNY